MQFETVPIDSISQDPANLRAHSRENLDRIKASLRRFGQQRALVVDNNEIIRAGNGTHQAAKELGWTEVTIHRTVLGGSEATAYSIADNAATRGSDWTSAADLANVLASLRDDGVPVEVTGFSDAELDAMLAKTGNDAPGGEEVDDPQAEWTGMPEFKHEDLTSFCSIHVHFNSAEDLEDFSRIIGQNLTEKTKSIWHPQQESIPYGEAE